MCENKSRNAGSMLYGGYIGKLRYLIENGIDISLEEPDNNTSNMAFQIKILNSINDKGHIIPNDIAMRMADCDFNGSVMYAMSPLAFADIFGIHAMEIDSIVENIARIVTNDDSIIKLCIEYVHLLHDILWFKIDKEHILEILPELDILESEVSCSFDEKDIFFAGLWSFIFSDNYEDCYEVASNLTNTNSDICGVACTLAGLYDGIQTIPTDWAEQVFEIFDKEALPIL